MKIMFCCKQLNWHFCNNKIILNSKLQFCDSRSDFNVYNYCPFCGEYLKTIGSFLSPKDALEEFCSDCSVPKDEVRKLIKEYKKEKKYSYGIPIDDIIKDLEKLLGEKKKGSIEIGDRNG